ncbi:MAG: hypothetical protein ACLSH6_03270 [Limosilactobacillus pontis]
MQLTLSWKMLLSSKETGPYVQYARARAESILRKGGIRDFSGVDLTKVGDSAWDLINFRSIQ